MSASVKTICKKSVLNTGLYPIYLRITIDRKSKFYSTPFSCKLNEWNEKQGEFNTKFRNCITYNKTLRKLKDDASDVIDELQKEYDHYNLILFDKIFSKKEFKGISFTTLFQKEIDLLNENDKINYSNSLKDTLRALKSFKKNIADYKFENIDFQFLTQFENFLRLRGSNDGGIGVYMRNIRMIYNKGINFKIVQAQYYPFRDFKISKYKKREIKKALTESEFEQLLNFDCDLLPSAKNARYLYLFSYYARGMNFTDLAELKWNDIDDYKFNYIRNKTDVNLKIKLPENAIIKEILEYYKVYRPFDTQYIFPILNKEMEYSSPEEIVLRKKSVISYYNKELKRIMKMCSIEKNITFYGARHTFATTALKNGVNMNIIKQSLGHKSIKTTEIYVEDFLDSEVDVVIDRMF